MGYAMKELSLDPPWVGSGVGLHKELSDLQTLYNDLYS